MADQLKDWIAATVETFMQRIISKRLSTDDKSSTGIYKNTGSGYHISSAVGASGAQQAQILSVRQVTHASCLIKTSNAAGQFSSSSDPILGVISDSHSKICVRFSAESAELHRKTESKPLTEHASMGIISVTDADLCIGQHGDRIERVYLLIKGFRFKGCTSPEIGGRAAFIVDRLSFQTLFKGLFMQRFTPKSSSNSAASSPSSDDLSIASQDAGRLRRPPSLNSPSQFASQPANMHRTLSESPGKQSQSGGENAHGPAEARSTSLLGQSKHSTGIRNADLLARLGQHQEVTGHIGPQNGNISLASSQSGSSPLQLADMETGNEVDNEVSPSPPLTIENPILYLSRQGRPESDPTGAVVDKVTDMDEVREIAPITSETREAYETSVDTESRPLATVHEGSFHFTSRLPQYLGVPAAQRQILDRPESWIHPEPGRAFPGLNVPKETLITFRSLAERKLKSSPHNESEVATHINDSGAVGIDNRRSPKHPTVEVLATVEVESDSDIENSPLPASSPQEDRGGEGSRHQSLDLPSDSSIPEAPTRLGNTSVDNNSRFEDRDRTYQPDMQQSARIGANVAGSSLPFDQRSQSQIFGNTSTSSPSRLTPALGNSQGHPPIPTSSLHLHQDSRVETDGSFDIDTPHQNVLDQESTAPLDLSSSGYSEVAHHWNQTESPGHFGLHRAALLSPSAYSKRSRLSSAGTSPFQMPTQRYDHIRSTSTDSSGDHGRIQADSASGSFQMARSESASHENSTLRRPDQVTVSVEQSSGGVNIFSSPQHSAIYTKFGPQQSSESSYGPFVQDSQHGTAGGGMKRSFHEMSSPTIPMKTTSWAPIEDPRAIAYQQRREFFKERDRKKSLVSEPSGLSAQGFIEPVMEPEYVQESHEITNDGIKVEAEKLKVTDAAQKDFTYGMRRPIIEIFDYSSVGTAEAKPGSSQTSLQAGSSDPALYHTFVRFKAAYPVYVGDATHFIGCCKILHRLHANKSLHRSLWDDFVVRHRTIYVPYTLRCSEEQTEPREFETFYHDEFDEPEYTLKVLNPVTLQQLLEHVNTESGTPPTTTGEGDNGTLDNVKNFSPLGISQSTTRGRSHANLALGQTPSSKLNERRFAASYRPNHSSPGIESIRSDSGYTPGPRTSSRVRPHARPSHASDIRGSDQPGRQPLPMKRMSVHGQRDIMIMRKERSTRSRAPTEEKPEGKERSAGKAHWWVTDDTVFKQFARNYSQLRVLNVGAGHADRALNVLDWHA